MEFQELEGAQRCYFKKGDILIAQGEKVTHLYYIVRGQVHREMLTVDGESILLTIKGSEIGDEIAALVGVFVLYDDREADNISNSDFIASTDCVCYRIPVTSYQEYAHDNLDIYKKLLKHIMGNYEALFDTLHFKKYKSTVQMLCRHLRQGCRMQDGKMVYERRLSNKELANYLHTHPDTVNKIFTALQEEGIILRTRTTITVVEPAALDDLAEGRRQISYRYKKQ